MPLRVRLVVILVLLVAVALAAVEPITYTTTRTSLVQKVNAQMATSVGAWTQYYAALQRAPVPQFEVFRPATFAALYTPRGVLVPFSPISFETTEIVSNPVSGCSHCTPSSLTGRFVRRTAALAAAAPNHEVFQYVRSSNGSFQVLTTIISGFVLVVALPLTGVDATMGHVLALELIIGAGIIVAVALASWFLVRLGLRPLERMATTASEIAAGDLSKRVEDTDERTEVGQLGAALNAMLTQIERAFRERAASEDRLRRFVGDASHELRTPLTSIRGYAELFKDGVGGRPEDLASALRRIESESTRMGGLVDDLLLLARLDQGRPLGHDRVDLAQLAVDAVQDASVVDPSRTIAVISAGPCVVVGDDQRLRQVVGNLITNAMAYSPPGSPIEVAVHMEGAPVDISGLPGIPAIPTVGRFGRVSRSGRLAGPTDPVSLPVRPLGPADLTASGQGEGVSGNGGGEKSDIAGVGRYLAPDQVVDPVTAPSPRTDVSAWQETRAVIAVIDHGPGIAPEIMPHVFERFWRADQSRQRSSGGSGLGLSIVAAVVAAHGGEVGIRQTPGGGATFAVELPAAPPPPPLGSVAGNGSVSGAISPSEVAD